MTLPSNLGDIITKFRRITAQTAASQISDAEIVRYVNTFYIFDLPMHLPLFNMKEVYTFYTKPNVDCYDFPRNTFAFIQPPLFVAGYQAFYSQSREQFFRTYPKLNFFEQAATGNGLLGIFNVTATQTPFLRANINENSERTSDFLISSTDVNGQPVQAIDTGTGLLTAVGGNIIVGTVNYITGAISINFALLPPNPLPPIPAAGQPINLQYVPYVASRPMAALFFQDQFFLRPVPDNVYQVQIDAWRYPTVTGGGIFDQANITSDPQVNEWWQVIAYGAADKFFADNADFENLQKFRPLLQEQLRLINRRTIKQQTNQRASTIYSDQVQFPYNNQQYRF